MTEAAAMCRKMKNRKWYENEEYVLISHYEIDKALDSNKVTDSEKLMSKEYHDFLPLFQEVNDNKLSPHRPYDYKIQLKEGLEPPFGRLYSLSRPELEELKKWV